MAVRYFFALFAALLFQTVSAWAQFGLGKPKDVAIVKSLPLLVILLDEDPKELERLAGKPTELADYRAYITSHNAQLKELVPKIWQFSPAVEFKREADLPALRKAKGIQQSVFRQIDFRLSQQVAYRSAGVMTSGFNSYTVKSKTMSGLAFELVGNGEERSVWRMPIVGGAAYASDLIFSLRSGQRYFQASAGGDDRNWPMKITQNGPRLQTKTLLIEEADLAVKLTTDDLKRAYPFPYQLASRAIIEAAAASSDSRYAYLRLLQASDDLMVPMVVDVASSELLGFSMHSKVEKKRDGQKGTVITKEDFQDLAAAARGK